MHGILVQLPLPPHIDPEPVIDAIDPAKDVDGFHMSMSGALATGQKALVPCTPLGCLMLLRDTLGDLTGHEAVVIGRSNIVGQADGAASAAAKTAPSRWRIRGHATCPRLCGGPTSSSPRWAGRRSSSGDWLRPGATVIDVGINRIEDGKLVGDVDFAGAAEVAGAITPVPGGVGPMTIACLLANTLTAACRQHGLPAPEGLSAS